MQMPRREFLGVAAAGLAASALPLEGVVRASSSPKFPAVAFDGFPVFDPRPVAALANQLFPQNGKQLMDTWRSRQFEYQWLRALGGHYADFLTVTDESLVFAARALNLQLTPEAHQALVSAYLNLKAWPDAAAALRRLHQAGVRLVFVSNMTAQMLNAGIRNSALKGLFEHVLSTDLIRTYKPDPRAYRLAVDALKLPAQQILFAPFAGWDLAGAKWFGHPTFWVNRGSSPAEQLGVTSDGSGQDLNALADFVLS